MFTLSVKGKLAMKLLMLKVFYKAFRLYWLRRYVFGQEGQLDDHWCGILDNLLGVKPKTRHDIFNRESEFFNKFTCKKYRV